jgi:GNAT superfamily N-acetyltransferase
MLAPMPANRLRATDRAAPGTFEAIFRALEADSLAAIGPMQTRPLVVPLHDPAGQVSGGLWGCTAFRWLHIQLLFVPPPLRRTGTGAALVRAAEHEAQARACLGAHVDRFSFQANGFYERLGYTCFGVLPGFPPGYNQHYLFKRFAQSPPGTGQ